MSIGKDTRDKDVFYYDNLTRKNSNEEEILGVTMDRKKRKTIYTTMVKSQLNYCPLVWMFCPRRSSNLINKVQQKALCIIYNDQLTDFKSLLLNHNEITIHQRNVQILMT